MDKLLQVSKAKKPSVQVSIIERFVKQGIKINYPREVKIAKKMLSDHDLEFWNSLELDFQLNSLAFFNTENGKNIVNQHCAEYYRD